MFATPIRRWFLHFRRQARRDGRGGVVIRPRSLYILPTRQGLLLALVLILMLAGSINYGSNLGHFVTFLLGGIWLSAILHTWRNLLGLSLRPGHAEPVFAGRQACFTLYVDNPGGLHHYGISLHQGTTRGESCDLAPGESQPLRIHLPAPRRGRLELPEVSLHSAYPLGLFHTWCYASLETACLVYPRPAATGEPPSEDCNRRSEDGDLGNGADDFIGLRNYRYGDSPRHVDWKAFARHRGLLSKQFGGDRSDRVELDWDVLPEVGTEQRLSLLCRFILQAESQYLTYGLRLPDVTIAPGQGELHQQRCLAALALFGPDLSPVRP